MLLCVECMESNVSFPVPGSTLISRCLHVSLCIESVESNVSFPVSRSTVIKSCVCCYVTSAYKIMRISSAWIYINQYLSVLICNEGVESNVSFPVPGSTLISGCLHVLLCNESVGSNVRFPLISSYINQ